MSDVSSLTSLAGKVALVAGGAGGIGAAVVSRLVASGARVFSLDLPNRPSPGGAVAGICDVSNPDDVRARLADIDRDAGRLDVVVHAVGTTRDARVWKLGDADWRDVLATNLDSAFYLVRAAVPILRRGGGGAVVLVSSINAERAKAGLAAYAASKAGLNALARTAAREVGAFGIRVNVVAPGWIETPMTTALPAELTRRAVEESALGRIGQPDDVARAVLYLATDWSRHVTGQVLRVDGGQLIG
jgi:NAD(P)-dependent dehydrogenase (short-subunit alcohol dehydrogenase family)